MLNKILNINDLNKNFFKKIENKNIVLCHGVFDMLHIGHLNHFEESRKFGQILIVSITKDEFVNKGPNRPVFNILQRAKLLAGLKIIDFVIINDKATAENIIKILKPNYYVKGIDYKNNKSDFTHNIKKEVEAVNKIGGKIKYTNSKKINSSKVLDTFDLIFSEEQKKIINKIRKIFNFETFKNFIINSKKLKILVIGDLIIDKYVMCDPLSKSGKGTFLTFKKGDEKSFLGGSGFIANQLANFSENVDLISVISNSKTDYNFIHKKKKKNIKFYPFLTNDSKTIKKTRYVEKVDYNKLIGIYELDNNQIELKLENKITSFLKKRKNYYDLIVVSDFGHGIISKNIINTINQTKAIKTINSQLNSSNRGSSGIYKFKRADFATMNLTELTSEYGAILDDKQILNLAKQLKKKIGLKNIIITRGKSGSIMLNEKNNKIICPAFAKNRIDKIGAGDALFALFSLCKASKLDDHVALFLSSLAAGYTVEKFGNDQPMNKSDLNKILSHII